MTNGLGTLARRRMRATLRNWWRWHVAGAYDEARWFWQRGRRGYADVDVWNFETYLARVISGGLRQLADNNAGWNPNLFDSPDAEAACYREIADWFTGYLGLADAELPSDPERRRAHWAEQDAFYARRHAIFANLAEVWGTLWD